MLEIRKKRMVTTRKVHFCFGCTKEINEGDNAVYVTAKEDDFHKRFHLHHDCNKIIAKDKRFSGSGLYYGCIKEANENPQDRSSIVFSPIEELPFI